MANDSKPAGSTCPMLPGGRRGNCLNVLVAVFFTAVATSLWQQRICANNELKSYTSDLASGLSGAGADKLMHSVGSVSANLDLLARQVTQLQTDLEAANPQKSKSKSRRRRVMLFTMIFGENAVNEPWLPLFIKSAGVSGVDYTIIGDPALPFDLPPNIHHVQISYRALVDKISDELFDGATLWMKDASLYKVIDVKPLLGYLFRDLIVDHGFWGHIDNDMIMGNVPRFLTPELLDNYDVISGLRRGDNGFDAYNTWGPFMIYRNIPKITQLFRHSPNLLHIFNNHSAFFFDEWGGGDGAYYPYSMTRILNEQKDKLGIRWHGGFPLGWDGECEGKVDKRCSECILSERFYSAGRTKSTLTWNRSIFEPDAEYKTYEVLMCHFQMGKKLMHDQFAKMTEGHKESLLSANPLIWSFIEGFHV
jgi:hypothetical protein